ncbi:hypothetical protein [Saccharothrix sp. ALI-22-I]|nr:hypothetical protein [Saccharothrix sp. ALI-22-I]
MSLSDDEQIMRLAAFADTIIPGNKRSAGIEPPRTAATAVPLTVVGA